MKHLSANKYVCHVIQINISSPTRIFSILVQMFVSIACKYYKTPVVVLNLISVCLHILYLYVWCH